MEWRKNGMEENKLNGQNGVLGNGNTDNRRKDWLDHCENICL